MPPEDIARLTTAPIAHVRLVAPQADEMALRRLLRHVPEDGSWIKISRLQASSSKGSRPKLRRRLRLLQAQGLIDIETGRLPSVRRGPFGEYVRRRAGAAAAVPLESRVERALRVLREMWADAIGGVPRRAFVMRMTRGNKWSARDAAAALRILEQRGEVAIRQERWRSRRRSGVGLIIPTAAEGIREGLADGAGVS
jgi:hypothetical protein